MRRLLSMLIVHLAWLPFGVFAQTIVLDGAVPMDAATHFFVPFEVPAGTVEIEIAHDDQSASNILDWGLEDPSGFRGWGGGNTEPAIVGVDRASRSYAPGPITPGTWRVVVGKAKLVELPASYHIEITLRMVGTLAAQPERAPYVDPGVLEATARWYAGDFHVHSRESGDAHPTLDAIATVAATRGLDFVAISDHNTHTALDFFVDAQRRHPGVLFVPNVEFTTYAGHANAIGATSWVNHRIGVEGMTIEAAAAAFRAQGAVFSLNHPALDIGDMCIGCAWEHDLPADAIDAVEIMTTGTDVVRLGFLLPSIARWDALCDTGRHVVPIGGSDDHRGGEGSGAFESPIGDPTTMVEATDLSVASLLEGLRRGRTVVRVTGPSAPMVVLTTREPLDADTVVARRTRLVAEVTGGIGRLLRVKRNGAPFGSVVEIDADPFHFEADIEAPAEGEDRYRVEVSDDLGPVTITSHVWIRRPPGGGGCVVVSGTGAGVPSFVLVAFVACAFVWARVRVAKRETSTRRA